MAYCTDADIKSLLEGTQYLRQGSELDFSKHVAWAEAWVNARLEAAGVTVPLSTAPDYIKLATANYACYLITRRPNVNGDFDGYSLSFRSDAAELIEAFTSGKADIPGDNTLAREHGAPVAVNPEP